jgi:hypothetical protein
MQLRRLAVRLVLIAAVLTTVATSAPPRIELSDTIDATIGPGPTTIVVFGNRAAVNHADVLHVVVVSRGGGMGGPDGEWPAPDAPIETTDPYTKVGYVIEDVCARDHDCSTTFTIQVPPGTTRDVSISVIFQRASDYSFFFPDNPPFPSGAVADIQIGP